MKKCLRESDLLEVSRGSLAGLEQRLAMIAAYLCAPFHEEACQFEAVLLKVYRLAVQCTKRHKANSLFLMRFAPTVSVVILMCVAWPVVGADSPLVVEIWPGKVPDESGNIGPERFRMSPSLDHKQVEVTEPTQMITDVTKPTITVYRPTTNKNTGTAVLICPGGGYWN